MSLFKSKLQIVLGLFVLGVGALIAFVAGLHVFMSTTAEVLHPDVDAIPSRTRSEAPAGWTGAVDEARRIVRAGLQEQNLTGLSVAVGLGGEVVWAEGFGWANLEDRSPVSPGTRFRIGTASIAPTSVAAGMLVEQGRLNLDERIQTYVPEYREDRWPITLRQLMAHVAGVPNDAGDEGPYGEACDRPVEGLRLFEGRSLLFEPGTRYRFSSFGWILVSAAIESAAGVPFHTFMRQQVFEPLRMDGTRPDAVSEPVAGRASFYFPRYAADPRFGLHPTRTLDLSCYAGAGAYLSTPTDLVRFVMAVNGGALLQPATVAQLQASQRLRDGQDTAYGLGWDIDTVTYRGAPTRIVGHDGTTMGGVVASVWTFPDRGIVVSVMSNLAHADTAAVAVKVAEVFAK